MFLAATVDGETPRQQFLRAWNELVDPTYVPGLLLTTAVFVILVLVYNRHQRQRMVGKRPGTRSAVYGFMVVTFVVGVLLAQLTLREEPINAWFLTMVALTVGMIALLFNFRLGNVSAWEKILAVILLIGGIVVAVVLYFFIPEDTFWLKDGFRSLFKGGETGIETGDEIINEP